ncbi:hypothetical protein BH10BDE1_BH10BDE1_20370 [soil metagenome]
MSIFETDDYKAFIRGWVADRASGGRGQYRQMAAAIGVSTTLVSQVVNGEKHFSMENSVDLAEFMALGERESEHFLLLVEFGRAGSHRYQERLKKRIAKAKQSAQTLSERLEKDRALTDHESATYYSNWSYTAITHLIACDPMLSLDALAERLHLPRAVIAKTFSFLIDTRLVVPRAGGGHEVGPKLTHIGADSPLVIKHHQNWRLKGMNQMVFKGDTDLFYTAPMSLSRETAAQIRAELPSFIEKIIKWVGPSPSETVRCLNIDWFEY